MDENNRKILVEQQKAKATRFIKQAEEMLSLRYFDLAANRYYYACFNYIRNLDVC